MIAFTSPLLLFLLLLLLPVAYLGWPQHGDKRAIFSLCLRLLILLCLVFSLAGFELNRRADQLTVVFLLDVSDSVPPAAREAGMDDIRAALNNMHPEDQAALVVFGGDALVERPMSPGRELGSLQSRPFPAQTDLAEAIRLGVTLFPSGTARRMVILSDGASTTGDALTAARLAVDNGVQVLTVPIGAPPESEALVTAVEAPPYLQQGERFDLRFSLSASADTLATVRVLEDGKVIYEGKRSLKAGEQTFSLPLTAGKSGFTRYQVQIEPQNDTWYQNNSLASFSQVAGPQKVLLVAPRVGEPLRDGSPRPDEAAQLEQALRDANFAIQREEPTGLPSELVDLARYAAVMLVDVPARQLNPAQMTAVQSFVRDLGGGLLVVGGPTSYGVGGYFRTPLEETLPVKMQITDQKRRPKLAMVFIIDRSGSMSETSGGPQKIELAKEAASRSTELLAPDDSVGVIAFDESATWVVPMTPLTNPDAIRQKIGSLRAGGGTDIMAGVQAMAKVLPGFDATVKHVVLLTDGGADPTGIPELVRDLNEKEGITLSVVAVGWDAATFLTDLATAGGGNAYYTAEPATIPSIFTEETTLATRAYLIEHPFAPQQLNPSPVLLGIKAVPQLRGYVATTIKETAQAVLVSDLKDPILATWQYGLGRAAAFTSDATGRWGADWLAWPGYPAFWAQAVRYTMRDRAPAALDVSIQPHGEQAQVIVDAQRAAGGYLNGYQMQARVVAPDGSAQPLTLRQVAPGQYSAEFTPGLPGAYLLSIQGEPPAGSPGGQDAATPGGAPGSPVSETAGWSFSYSPEYSRLQGDRRALEQIAALSQGKPLDLEGKGALGGVKPGDVSLGDVSHGDTSPIFRHDLTGARAHQPAWPWLVALAALLLPLDIAARRLLLGPRDLWLAARRSAAWLRARLQPRPRPARPASHVSPLLQVKLPRQGQGQIPGQPPAPAPTPQPVAPPPAAEPPPPPAAPPAVPPRPAQSGGTVSSLLAGKRERKG